MRSPTRPILALLAITLPQPTLADGTGLIGWGKTLYNPACAFACRNVLRDCTLSCTPGPGSGANHGTAHNPVDTPPDCFVRDEVFLRTMALCVDTYCVRDRERALLEAYWREHLGTGTLGTREWVPVLGLEQTLRRARADEREAGAAGSLNGTGEGGGGRVQRVRMKRQHNHGAVDEEVEKIGPDVSSPLPFVVSGDPLNQTSFVDPEDWQVQYNGMTDFETNEAGHSTYTITIILIALLLPIAFSLLRFIPGFSTSDTIAFFRASLITPALWGRHHRQPIASYLGGAILPTRGQTLYIALLSFLNIIFLTTPFVHTHPQSTFASGSAEQSVSTIGNRAGVMAMGNAVAMFLFAGRNNPLLLITDWSHGTFLLLHRWLGYWTVFHTVLHSVMLLAYYKTYGSYAEEIVRMYWIWGIVATVAACLILPTSLLIVRQRLYELFKAAHVALTVLFIVGYYYHIWYCYGFSWGYEIFAYIVGAIWGLEHVLRIGRLAKNGMRTATVTLVPGTEGEYVRIEVEGVALNGTAYLTFPTLSWRFWESHPFSVAYGGPSHPEPLTPPSKSNSENKDEPTSAILSKQVSTAVTALSQTPSDKKSVFIARTRTGMTSLLSARAAANGPAGARLRVLIDGSYHSSATGQLKHCAALLCIGGGVGITALLHHLRNFPHSERSMLHWGTRRRDLVDAMAAELASLPAGVRVETMVGERVDIDAVLGRELLGLASAQGRLGIVVCGPAGMADDLRAKVVSLSRETATKRDFMFVDEAFSW